MTKTFHSDNGSFWAKIYKQGENVVTRKIADELFIVPVSGNLANMQRMFALTPVGSYIWQLLDGKRSLSHIRNAVLETYDAGESHAESDIREFVADLLVAGLIREEEE